MWKWFVVVLGIGAALATGIFLGDRGARESFAGAGKKLVEIAERASKVAEQDQANAVRRRTLESLLVAKMLRSGDVDGAVQFLDGRIESGRAEITREAVPTPSTADANILRSIQEYQARYPWSPPPVDAAASELQSQFGALAPTIQDGKLIGFRVAGVKPGSVFAQVGIENGDVITQYNGQAVSLDGRPTLVEMLQSGSSVDLVVRGSNGAIRHVQVPER